MSFVKQLVFHLMKFGHRGFIFFIRKKYKQKGEIISIRPDGVKHPVYLRNKTSDIACFNDIFFGHPYFLKLDFEPKTIVDLGANVGLASVYFKKLFPQASIYAVEPESENFQQLESNLAPYEGIHTYNKGIWHTSARLKINESQSGAWGFILEEAQGDDSDTVEAISMEEIIDNHKLDAIDILKVDIEGSELELFSKNFESWLPLVKVIIIEFHDQKRPNTSKTFFKALENYNYTIEPSGENLICRISGKG